MAGTEKRGPRRGRGRSKRPREQDVDINESSQEAPRQPSAHSFRPINYSAPSTPAFSTFGVAGQSSGSNPTAQSTAGPRMGESASPIVQSQAPPGKVAIPSIRPPPASHSARKESKRGRTPHACDACRKAKAGCSGRNPCTRCESAGVPCIYGDGKRDKERKRVSKLSKATDSLSQHNFDVSEALRRIRLDESLTPDGMRSALDEVLAMTPAPFKTSSDEDRLAAPPESSDRRSRSPSLEQGSDESDDTAGVGSIGALDEVDVDTDRTENRATGHMGKSSSVTWAKRTANEVQQDQGGKSVASLLLDGGFSSTTYHTEDKDVGHIEPKNVDFFDWPDPKIADEYVQSYFEHVHFAFPILHKVEFMLEYNQFERGSRDLTSGQRVWLGTLNAMFAISSQYAQVTETEQKELHFEHYIYCARAKGLLVDEGFLYQDVSIKLLRALGLLSLYYMTTCRINRAWTLCGLAVRHALALGLHVRSEAKELSDVGKEQRVRLWWSLYSMECSLNELTGRPSCISDQDISTPLPTNADIDELRPGQSLYGHEQSRAERYGSFDRPAVDFTMPIGTIRPLVYAYPIVELPITSATYFIYQSQLTIISHEIVSQLYCAATIKVKWSDVQISIKRIDHHLTTWRDSLPTEFDVDFDEWPEPDWTNHFTLLRIGLALHYHSSRMILFRPCLCRFDKDSRLGSQSAESQAFNQSAVVNCIESARRTISMLKGATRSMKRLFLIAPWWQTIHFICEAMSILVLEMAYRAQHMRKEAKEILDDAKKGVYWLATMAGRSISARKAWEIYDVLVKATAPMIGWSVFDMPNEAPCPLEYREWRSTQSPERASAAEAYQASLQPYFTTDQTSSWMAEQQPTWTDYDLPYEQMLPNPLNPNTVVFGFTSQWDMRNRWFNSQPSHTLFNIQHAPEALGMSSTARDEMMSAPEGVQEEGLTGAVNPRDEIEVYMPSASFYGTPNPFPFAQTNRDFDFGDEQDGP